MPLENLSEKEVADLRALALQDRVVYEIHPAINYVTGQRRQIGFDVMLFGAHGKTDHPPVPGCEYCRALWHELKKIAQAVTPAGETDSLCEIQPFDAEVHESKARRFRDDVELLLTIRHKQNYLDPFDARESKCADEAIAALKNLGVQERQWQKYRARWFSQSHGGGSK